MSNNIVDLRSIALGGVRLSSYLDLCRVELKGVKFGDALLHPNRGNPHVRFTFSETHYVVMIERQLLASIPDQVLKVEFPVLLGEQLPSVIIDPQSIRLQENETIASQVLARLSWLVIRRTDDLIEFKLNVNGLEHEKVIALDCLMLPTETRRLGHFLDKV